MEKTMIYKFTLLLSLFIILCCQETSLFAKSLDDRDEKFRYVLANPLTSRSFVFLAANDSRKFGGSIGNSFSIFMHRFQFGLLNFRLNMSANTLTRRDKTIFYLKDIDYLFGVRIFYSPQYQKYWAVFSLQHISSHLGDGYFLIKNQEKETPSPIIFSLEFLELSFQKYWSGFRIESGGLYVYHTTENIPRLGYFLGGEKTLLTIASLHRLFTSLYFIYSPSQNSILNRVFQIGTQFNLPNTIPFALTLEIRSGQFMWGQFYRKKQTEYLIKLYFLLKTGKGW